MSAAAGGSFTRRALWLVLLLLACEMYHAAAGFTSNRRTKVRTLCQESALRRR